MGKIATERVFAEDANGITRLVAAPGDVIPTEVVTAGVVQTPPDTPHVVPVDGYDDLSEDEVLAKLPELDAETIEIVRAYEQAHLARGSITRYGLKSRPVDVPRARAAGDSAKPGYKEQKVEDLQAEAERRGLEVEGTGKDGKVLRDDLVAALEASDE